MTAEINAEINAEQSLAELVERAAAQEIITLTAAGQKKAVLLSLDAFESLIGMQAYRQRQLMPNGEFQAQFHQALVDAGYDSREAIIDLVQEVKREMAAERQQRADSSFSYTKSGV